MKLAVSNPSVVMDRRQVPLAAEWVERLPA
jgi:hypothetical protein